MILWPSKFVYFNEKIHCCHGRRHDVTCSRRKCYVMCGHNIIYNMSYPLNISDVMIMINDNSEIRFHIFSIKM